MLHKEDNIQTNLADGEAWIGIKRNSVDRSFEQSGGYPIIPYSSEVWNLGEPSNQNEPERCVYVVKVDDQMKLGAKDCNETKRFLCRIPFLK